LPLPFTGGEKVMATVIKYIQREREVERAFSFSFSFSSVAYVLVARSLW
jgi:hypothetical protein